MSKTKTINNTANSLYKLQDSSSGFISNSFPIRRLVRSSVDNEQAWIAAYKAENKKYFEAVLTNQKLDQLERDENDKEQKSVPKRTILKKLNFLEDDDQKKNPHLLDGFYLMQLCCVEDPLDLSSVDISDKNLNQIKEDDMALFENIVEVNANENFLNFESFKNFPNLQNLFLACNNIKTIRLKHEDFVPLQSLDLSFNNLSPIDVAHLGVLKNLKFLKLTGNNLNYLPDTLSKLYVYTKDNKKIVSEKFPSLEELYLDHNKLKEEDSFDVLSVLKKLKRLHLNSNNITCVPNLKIFRKNHVFQEFNKSYYKRKNKTRQKSAMNTSTHRSMLDQKLNEGMVKDLDRPSSEMNIHNANALRNSFILEENEDELDEESNQLSPVDEIDLNNQTAQPKHSHNSVETFDKSFDLPFPELVYINLADNQIAEEDDLIGLASWPMLNEIIIYGNPIVYNNVGYPPLLKQYLIDRLGINIHRVRPLKALKTPVLIPQREHRIVDSQVPKVPKIPVEMRMLTYYQEDETGTNSKRSNLSSAESIQNGLGKSRSRSSQESFDTGGHLKNDNVYKPFKHDKILKSFREGESQHQDESDNDYDDETFENQEDTNEKSKDYNSFFMTQVDQEEIIPINIRKSATTGFESPRPKDRSTKQTVRNEVNASNRTDYEILYQIENEEQIRVPKDIGGSVRALKQMLDNPLIFREPCAELDKPQVVFKSKLKERNDKLASKPPLQPKLNQINEILDTLKDRKTVSEMNLSEALARIENKKEYEKAKNLLEKAQKRYEEVKRESLRPVRSPRRSRDDIKYEIERIKSANNQTQVENLT